MSRATHATIGAERAVQRARTLALEIGPRRPTSRAERTAFEWLRGELKAAGLTPRLESFRAYSTFALPQGLPLIVSLTSALTRSRWPRLGSALGLLGLVGAAAEDDLRLRAISRLVAWAESRNLVATIEPRGPVVRTVCLVAHVDSSRSGVMFHPALAARIRPLLALTSASLAAEALAPLLERRRATRRLAQGAGAWLGVVLALLAERELRGEDVPGANDNASGAAVTTELAVEVADSPLEGTRVVLLVTGAEEAGTLGIDAFLRSHATEGWLFLNFDGVGASATLRYLRREGMLRTHSADERLLGVAAHVASRRPELGLEPASRLVGLTYDATPVLARGGRALTISAQDDAIPNYHQPSDDAGNLDANVIGRALEVGRQLIAAIDRGAAD